MITSAHNRLDREYRVIRALSGGADAPWPGSLVCVPSGELGVRVDARLLGPDWRGWDAAADGHLLAPVDVLRRPDGHDALLPVCAERLDAFLSRRSAEGAALSAGEAVTVAVSVMRGLAELPSAEETGEWWLTDSGRPMFAAGAASTTAAAATPPLLEQLTEVAPQLAPAVAGVLHALSDPRRLRREVARAEDAAFAVAEPVALATTTFGPKAARSAMASPAHDGDAEPATPGWHHALARHVDGEWADLLSRITTDIWRRLRTPPHGRRPWLVAGGLAVVIVGAGALWPAADTTATAKASAAAEQVPSPVAISSPTPAASPGGEPEPQQQSLAPPEDLAHIAETLLEERSACRGLPECLADVQENPTAVLSGTVIDLPRASRSLVLLDDFGGAAVLRAEAAGAASQLVVIVRAGQRWLLRDVHDIAQQ